MDDLIQLIEASTSAAAKAINGDQGNIDAAVKSLVALKDFKVDPMINFSGESIKD